MRLPFQEIRNRAIQFAHDWRDAHSERAEAQTFWNEFFNVFGINRRSVASFEATVRNLGGSYDRIDVIWQGVLIGEHKSRGEDLSRAASQAFGYVQSLTTQGRDDEVPRYVIVSDFARMVLYDLEAADPTQQAVQFDVADLHQNIRRFDFLSGIQSRAADPEDPINIRAVEVLGQLHDVLERSGYTGHQLERFLVRILFCLFAEDTGIFEPDAFKLIVENSSSDGSDLGPMLERLFRVLDTADDSRQTGLPEALAAMPYVNGELFAERLDMAEFNADTRNALLAATRFQWSKISPAVFGSLFQSIMASEAGARRRRQIGAHYTSERDIMKLIRSLFLDDLRADFERAKARRSDLVRFHDRIANLKFLDPACGCGNFLVIAYRELRRLEIEVIAALHASARLLDSVDLELFTKIAVDQMHGIEIEEWPARIAEVAMWLIDHQMNLEASQRFGKPLLRLPLRKTARIHHGNALRVDWNEVLPAAECSYVMGNPPFVGKKEQSASQKEDMQAVWNGVPGTGILDYVTCWYRIACRYATTAPSIQFAFVSTNSISQGEQVAPFWGSLLAEFAPVITFAHRTFAWQSEARGRAHVHVVIIGLSSAKRAPTMLFEYPDINGDPIGAEVDRINCYLTDAPNVLIDNRRQPLCSAPSMNYGSMMIDKDRSAPDSEGLILAAGDREQIVARTPEMDPFIRRLMGGDEFLNGAVRWCLWLDGAAPSTLRSDTDVQRRVQSVRTFRLSSNRPQTRALAETPTVFGEIRQPSTAYLLFPKVGSASRRYFPIGFVGPDVIATGSALIVPGATLYHFGVLSSAMHTAWFYFVGGRMKSDPQYSAGIVYNNFPWPQEVITAKREAIDAAAQEVLDARGAFAGQTLADLYDPLAMPRQLREAHAKLDRAVDKCYRSAAFSSDRQRVEFLFGVYERLANPILPAATPRRGTRRRPTS
jgi:type I restriction-modification system DNA methylase subunit